MAENWTQGEWKIKENGKHETPSIWANFPDNSGAQEVCRIKDTFGNTCRANARLISQAPRMAKALKSSNLSLKGWLSQHPDDEILQAIVAWNDEILSAIEGEK